MRMHCNAGFPADLCVEEILIIVKEASDATYANVDFAIKIFCTMGYEPFTCAVLDDTDILSLASPEVEKSSSLASNAKASLPTQRSPVLLLIKLILFAWDQVDLWVDPMLKV